MLESYTVDTFSPLIGTRFVLELDAAASLTLELMEAVSLGGAASGIPSERRRPFSLVFRGPSQPVANQRIYRLDHASLGAFELFLVPIGPDEAGMRYEAIFT
jgi:hypothetical protein